MLSQSFAESFYGLVCDQSSSTLSDFLFFFLEIIQVSGDNNEEVLATRGGERFTALVPYTKKFTSRFSAFRSNDYF